MSHRAVPVTLFVDLPFTETSMNILMMGTGGFAVPTFEALLDSKHRIACLVTRPAKSARGRRPAPSNPMRTVAEASGVPVFDPESINHENAHTYLESKQADLFVVCDYGQILSANILKLAPYGGINLHASLLPKYRGAAPINWALYHGETETGVTVIHMTPQLDAGPSLVQCRVTINPDETAIGLEERLATLGVDLVLEAIALLETDTAANVGEDQDSASATKAPRLKKSDGQVDWSRTARQIHDQVRALKPWPRTFTDILRPEVSPVRVILDEVHPVMERRGGAFPGQVVLSDVRQLVVATGEGTLEITRIQPAGKRVMAIDEFQRGYAVGLNAQFG